MNNIETIEKNAEKVKETFTEQDKRILDRLEQVRLSDLIRVGSRTSDQAFGWTGPQGEMCALSSALAGAKAYGLR